MGGGVDPARPGDRSWSRLHRCRPTGEIFDLGDVGTVVSECYLSRTIEVTKSVFDRVECDSQVERDFVADLQVREDVKFFLKLPFWFVVATPVGFYNPDWAIVLEDASGDGLRYLIAETKGSLEGGALRGVEWAKVECGKAHFGQVGVEFRVLSSGGDL